MRVIDLRSDTITKPTPAMRRAMAEADVGDDVFGEDPTVNRLEAMAASRLGKEAALLVTSGTMGNLAALMAHCGRGDEIILGDRSHTFLYEQGGSAALAGVHSRPLRNQTDGTLALSEIEAAIRPENIHFPRTRLIVLENTHNRCNGSPIDMDYMRAVREVADLHQCKIHVDGARIFNAAVALNVEARDLVEHADSVTFCLSKGLAAPVGSVVCGDSDFVAEARRARKVLGGGMRQAGVLAAAGIVALDEMVERLSNDHENARTLAAGLTDLDGVSVNPASTRTNIVYLEIKRPNLTSQALAENLHRVGVRLLPTGPHQLRAVTNYHISPDDIQHVLSVLRNVMKQI